MKGKEKKDLSTLKCYRCGEYGHYVRKCLQKKKGDNEKRKEIVGVATSSKLDEFSRRLGEEFALVSHFSKGDINDYAWYVDSGSSKHDKFT